MTNKEAIEILKKEIDGIPDDLDTGDFTNAVRLAIKSLENARPHGKWRVYEGVITCEKCGTEAEETTPFCAWCGADMREVDND